MNTWTSHESTHPLIDASVHILHMRSSTQFILSFSIKMRNFVDVISQLCSTDWKLNLGLYFKLNWCYVNMLIFHLKNIDIQSGGFVI
jgi:hypothetical protein